MHWQPVPSYFVYMKLLVETTFVSSLEHQESTVAVSSQELSDFG